MFSELFSYYYGKHRARREMSRLGHRRPTRHEAALGRMIGWLLIALFIVVVIVGLTTEP